MTTGVIVAASIGAALSTGSAVPLAVGCGAVAAAAVLLARRAFVAVKQLETTVERIASGDFDSVTSAEMPTRELSDMHLAIDRLRQSESERARQAAACRDDLRATRQSLHAQQQQAVRQERLVTLGHFMSGVVHEVNNSLQSIVGFADLLRIQRDVPETVRADVDLISKEGVRACEILQTVNRFTRQQSESAVPMRLTEVIRVVADLRRRTLASSGIELCVEDGAQQYVSAVAAELQQVLLNLVVNAEQAIRGAGSIPARITIRSCDAAGCVVLEVEDTGPGLAPEDETKLFQPFFTTKPAGEGTGLGLSVSREIVDSLGGRIGYRRAVNGALFYFELPALSVEAV